MEDNKKVLEKLKEIENKVDDISKEVKNQNKYLTLLKSIHDDFKTLIAKVLLNND